MAEKKSLWKLRVERAAQRERLRGLAVNAFRAIREEPFLTWQALAERLNRKRVVNHLGRSWTGPMVLEFVRIHEAATGERLVPWKGHGGSASGREALKKGRCAYLDKRIELREMRAREIREHCGSLDRYADAAAALNGNGCRTQWGPWTKTRLASFVRDYEEKCGEKLMPSIVAVGGRARKMRKR
jgi:hypothetical protein